MRGVTKTALSSKPLSVFQLTRLMRGVTSLSFRAYLQYGISTHTPHARRDTITARDNDF